MITCFLTVTALLYKLLRVATILMNKITNHTNASVLMLLERNVQYYFVYKHNLNYDSYSIPFLSCKEN